MRKILIAIIAGLLFGSHALSQPYRIQDLKQWQVKGFAKSAADQGDYNSAIYFYEYLVKKYPKKVKYYWQLAYQYQYSRDYAKAYEAFDSLSVRSGKKSVLAQYYKALNAKSLGFHDEAYQLLKKIKVKGQKKWMPADFEILLDNHQVGCQLAVDLKDSIQRKKMMNPGEEINHGGIEFNPFYISDTIFVYSSSNMDTLRYVDEESSLPKRRFYYAHKDSTGWRGGAEPELPFYNSDLYDTGDGVFSIDGNRFYFTQCNPNWKNKMVCHLYVTHRVNRQWTEPQKLPDEINVDNYSSTEPAVGTCYDPNLEVVYFVSDRPGGYGETDIWYTIYDLVQQTYQKPVNGGIYLNTSGSEATPFYDRLKHRMYFSSDGLPVFGGMDVFYAQGDLVNWDEPVNLGYPVNSNYDDLYYSENQMGDKGFITSNRPGGEYLTHETCCDDVYAWKSAMSEKVKVTGVLWGNEMKLNEVDDQKGLLELVSKVPGKLNDAKINIYIQKDSTNLIYINSVQTNAYGEFEFLTPVDMRYVMEIDDRRAMDKAISFNTLGLSSSSVVRDLNDMVLPTMDTIPVLLEGVFKDGNSTKLSNRDKARLDGGLLKLMNEYKDILVEVGSHTEGKGNAKYNQRLSGQRAKAVVKYLVSKGVDANRLKAVGYGGLYPIQPNKNADGTYNRESKAVNVRTEFRLLDSKEIQR